MTKLFIGYIIAWSFGTNDKKGVFAMINNVDTVLNNDIVKRKKAQDTVVKCVKSGVSFPSVLGGSQDKKFVKDFQNVLSQIKFCKNLKLDPTPAAKDQLEEEIQKLLVLYKDFREKFVVKKQFKCIDSDVYYVNLNAMMEEFREDKKAASANNESEG